MNDYKKTPGSKRDTYSYDFLEKNTKSFYMNLLTDPKDDAEKKKKADWEASHPGESYAAYWIAYLHRADDRIVQNNLDCCHIPLNEEEKKKKEDFEKIHPGETYTGHWHLRLDSVPNTEDGCAEDKSFLQKESADSRIDEEPNLIIERLREIVSTFSDEWKIIYELVLLQDYPMAEVARMQGVTEGAIRKKVKKIKAQIASDTKLNNYF